jgi:hypothetical protein
VIAELCAKTGMITGEEKSGRRIFVNVLIFTVCIGDGHNQVANTLKEELIKQRNMAIVVDALEFVSPFLSRVVLDSYLKLLRHTPELYGKLYELTEEPPALNSGR